MAVRLLQITDTHLFASDDQRLCGVQTSDSLARVLAHARSHAWPPDAILATGDLSQDETPESYGRFVDKFSSLGAPVHCIAGNHDAPRRMVEMFVGSFTVNLTRWADLGAWQAVMLDTSVPNDNAGELAAAELEFLETALRGNPDRHALVCLHHNPVPVGSRWLDTMQLRNSAAFFDVIDRFTNVRAVLWGHVHQEFDGVRNGVRLLAAPSTCFQFLPGSENFALDTRPPGYRSLTLHDDGRFDTAVHRLDSFEFRPDLTTRGY